MSQEYYKEIDFLSTFFPSAEVISNKFNVIVYVYEDKKPAKSIKCQIHPNPMIIRIFKGKNWFCGLFSANKLYENFVDESRVDLEYKKLIFSLLNLQSFALLPVETLQNIKNQINSESRFSEFSQKIEKIVDSKTIQKVSHDLHKIKDLKNTNIESQNSEESKKM